MKKAINVFIAASLMFLLLLGLSGVAGDVFSHVLYAAACIVPTLFALFSKWGEACREKARYLTIDASRTLVFLPTAIPVVAVVMGLSFLTSFIMGATLGISNVKTPEELGGNILIALLLHALVPAVLEELLFRYVPLRLIARRSPRCAVIVSSMFFALVHADFFVIPYALFAGVAFMVLDIALESVYPSVILHFINNALSVAFAFYGKDAAVLTIIYITLAVLTLVSALFIFIYRKKYSALIKRALDRGEDYKLSNEVLLVIIPCLVLAVVRLIGAIIK